MICAQHVRVSYGSQPIIKDVTFDVEPGSVLGLVGPNGSGKTTVLRLLSGSLAPDAGDVSIGGTPVQSLRPRKRAQTVAVVVQENELDTGLTVAEMVLLGRSPWIALLARPSRHDRRVAEEALRHVGALGLAGRDLGSLSGGEKQRVLIARALAQETDVILLDEPTNHLDLRYQHEVLDLVRGTGRTVVVVLHDLNLAAQYCDRIALLDHGVIVANGTPESVLTPEILEPVYSVAVTQTRLDGGIHVLTRKM